MNKEYLDIFESNLPSILKDFLTYSLSIKGQSINSIKGYRSDLTLFFKYILMEEQKSQIKFEDIDILNIDMKKIKSITLDHLINFISFTELYLNNSNYARARKISALKSFFKYLHDIKLIIHQNPAENLEMPKIPKRHPIYLNLEESKDLLRAVKNSKDRNMERDFCIITLFLNCGLRLSELCNINISKIKDDTLKIVGKGNKERTAYLNKASLKAINEYLPIRETIIPYVPDEDKDALFISSKKRRISQRAVERLVKKYVQIANLDYTVLTPHKLRHTSATLMYKYGKVDLRSIQSLLGHESISTTEIYTHVDEEDLRDAVYANPLSKD
ncbi:tyrosine recombinase XerC [Hathewaya histolytica]|uniref:Site-specific recombinase XerD n=1 Tax=Hathewaya histolytica TaxID=1498 RepID=A0A4U9RE79_HATHI|nr:tyrosine recombinase XerC [Hathewaya histolytica]VTQ89368.1 site-specific recombinase XerD [Hathewaya histolytica]